MAAAPQHSASGPGPRPSLARLLAWTALPLAGNALLYLAYRDASLWCFRWVEALGAEAPVASLRRAAARAGDPGEFVRFSLASGLWVLGVVSFLLLTWRGPGARRARTGWVLGVLGLCLGSEALQALGWIPGTADFSDAAAYLAGTLLALQVHASPRADDSSAPEVPRAHFASLGLVTGSLLLATGAIYAGALGELLDTWL